LDFSAFESLILASSAAARHLLAQCITNSIRSGSRSSYNHLSAEWLGQNCSRSRKSLTATKFDGESSQIEKMACSECELNRIYFPWPVEVFEQNDARWYKSLTSVSFEIEILFFICWTQFTFPDRFRGMAQHQHSFLFIAIRVSRRL
jgi:hypothetical protein